MKRLICGGLACLLLVLTGCVSYTEGLRDPVTFYYVRRDYREDMSSPIGSEQREASGHQLDLHYLLSLYMMGPSQEALVRAFPQGTKVMSLEREGSALDLVLSDVEDRLSEAEYALACLCLSRTLLELTDAQSVTIASGSRSITMTNDNVSTQDGQETAINTEGTQ